MVANTGVMGVIARLLNMLSLAADVIVILSVILAFIWLR